MISGRVVAVERDEERDYLVARISIAIAGPDRVFEPSRPMWTPALLAG